ncbi:zinc finger protein 148-like [Scleropages formosus]|uniref:Zinc finger protein 148-like n=1 Tax=Scleropages formosus TaxID=113540 RepID=A0A0P7TRQ4_SCLFO|nr:zinc finger protein 148-like [Scleropages formosus]
MMNIRDSLVRTLHKCSGPADTRGAAGTLEDMTVGERALAHHALLAETRVDEEQGLDGNLVTGALPTHSVPMVHAQKVENDDEVDPDVRQQLCHKLAHPLQLLMGVKQELKVSDSEIHVKEERKRVRGLPEKLKKKNRKQHSPAKILTVSSNGSLGLQSTKAHMCEHCNATFRTNYHLQRHLFIHTGEKPFQCSQCDMRFIQKYLLQRHEKIHTVLKHKRICQKSRDCKASRIPSKDRYSGTCEDNSLSVLAKECSLPEKKRRKSCQKFHEGSAMFSENGNSKGKVVQRLCKKAPLYAISPKVSTYMVAEYSVEQPPAIVPPSWGSSAIEINPPKFVLKKVLCKQVQKPHLEQIQALSYFEDGKATRYTFELVDKQGLLDVDANTDLDPAGTLHAASSKSVASSTNYDDAVQFLKKKRYLQGATSSVSRGYTLNLGSVAPQSSTPQAALSTLPDDGVPTVILDAQTLNVGIKSNSAKTLLPDEVLQTLLDHYSNKGTCQPKISFSVANAEVPSNVSVDSLDLSSVSQPDTLGTNSEALPAEKSSMLREYSKFLQQALERTSQNDLNSHSLAFAAESPSLSCQPLFSSFDTVTNRFQSGINSPLRASSEKSHFGLLAGDSHNSMSFSGDETNPSSVSSSEDFLEKVTSSKKSHAQVIHQTFEMSTFEQNLYPQFQSLQSGTSSQFSTINGQENLRGLVSGTFFPEFPMVTVSKARTQLTSSPDDSSSQTFD